MPNGLSTLLDVQENIMHRLKLGLNLEKIQIFREIDEEIIKIGVDLSLKNRA